MLLLYEKYVFSYGAVHLMGLETSQKRKKFENNFYRQAVHALRVALVLRCIFEALVGNSVAIYHLSCSMCGRKCWTLAEKCLVDCAGGLLETVTDTFQHYFQVVVKMSKLHTISYIFELNFIRQTVIKSIKEHNKPIKK